MELALTIYKEILKAKHQGYIIDEKVIDDAFRAGIEAHLKDKHAEDYHGTDDDMPDDFERYLAEITEENEPLSKLIQ